MVVRIDHPPHNFMTAEMVRELHDLVRSVDGDDSVGAVVITGKPDDLYITHYDVGEILASVQRAGIAAPPWLTGLDPEDRGCRPQDSRSCAISARGRRSRPSSSSTGSTICSWR